MNRTNLILIVVFAVLAGLTGWYVLKKQGNTSLEGADYQFAVSDTASIYKVFLADKVGNRITLERKDKFWTVNGKYKARQTAINNLLETIKKVELKYRAPKLAIPNLVSDLMTHGIKVEIYNKNNKLLKSYYVGGTTNDEMGTHMIMEGANEPYITHMPAFDGGLRIRYFTKEIEWRDRSIFVEPIENIQSCSVEYPKLQSKSFKLERKGKDEFVISPFHAGMPPVQAPYRKGSAEQYLLGFEKQIAESFENTNPTRDSISKLVPFCIISLKTMDGVEKTARLHPIISTNKYGEKVLNNEGQEQIERYFADISTGDYFLVQHQLWQKLFVPIDFFFMTNSKGGTNK